MEGTPFGRYRLLTLLGRGGMGEVWRAFDTETQRVIALKVLSAHLANDPQFEQRFRREAFAAAGLAEPHVVPIHNFGEIDGRLYVDMRLIEGRDLQSILANGPLAPARAVAIIDQVAAALDAAHRIRLVHRDVKPSNILVAERDFAYLIDFGIARVAGDPGLTGTGSVVGTWHYMAPERFSANEIDTRADIYALACVLYECLTASRPFPGDTLESQVAAHLSKPPPRPSATNPGAPRTFDAVVAKGMAKNPDHRYSTTEHLARAARDAITTPIPIPQPPPAPRQNPYALMEPSAPPGNQPPPRAAPPPVPSPPQPPATPAPAKGRKGVLWGGLAAAVVAVIAVVGGVLVMANRDPDTGPVARPFTGTYSAKFGPVTDLGGGPTEGPALGIETWSLRSACGTNGCVATASRAGGHSMQSDALVFDEVDGRWLAVDATPGECKGNPSAEGWVTVSLQSQSEDTLTGEYVVTAQAGCAGKYPVTFTRTSDAPVGGLTDPASLPARVVSPAHGLHGRYADTVTRTNGSQTHANFTVRTDCLRSGERCLSYFWGGDGSIRLVFDGGEWTQTTSQDTPCGGGTQHTTITIEYPLPQPPADPFVTLTGQGKSQSTGACPGSNEFDEKFVRTGD